MYKLDLKPVSVNEAYKGRRFSTDIHRLFKDQAAILLRRLKLPRLKPKEEFFVIYKFYTSSRNDADNLIKLTQDSICAALGTDDRYISGIYVRKIKVKKGNERIEFDVFQYEYDMLQAIQNL